MTPGERLAALLKAQEEGASQKEVQEKRKDLETSTVKYFEDAGIEVSYGRITKGED
jgi:hypothetical protein